MDAVKFVKEYLRMCTKVDACGDFPVYKTDFCTVPANERSQESAEKIVELVEGWSAAHPLNTRQDVFLEQYPEARIYANGVLGVCPAQIVQSHRANDGGCIYYHRNCANCRRDFWLQEVE